MSKSNKRGEVAYLRVELNDTAKRFISEYLNSDPVEHHKVALAMDKVARLSDRVNVNKYNGQYQVNAYFAVGEGGALACVGGLGVKPDLAWLSCYAKCEFVLDWQFESVDTPDIASDKPQFS